MRACATMRFENDKMRGERVCVRKKDPEACETYDVIYYDDWKGNE